MWRGLDCLLILGFLMPQMAMADLWSGFYKATAPTTQPQLVGGEACVGAILDAQDQYRIPDNLMLAIGIQEAGRQVDGQVTVWPWAVNAEGKGIFFPTKDQAVDWVRTQLAQGMRSIDVGCMQVNLHWHGAAFASLEEAFDPVANARYAARFLTDLNRQDGDWWEAAGSYHSRTAEHRDRYLGALVRNHRVANAQFDQLAAGAKRGARRYASASPKLPAPPVLWSDGGGAEGTFSIYSRQPIGPVLPVFQDVSWTDE